MNGYVDSAVCDRDSECPDEMIRDSSAPLGAREHESFRGDTMNAITHQTVDIAVH